MKTVIATGQSNMLGRNPGGLIKFLPGVTVWNNLNDVTTLAGLGNAFVAPDISQRPFDNNSNNLAIHFCNELKRRTGEDVRLILVATGSQGISQWADTAGVRGAMYLRMQAVLAAAGVASCDIFLFHQGENDNSGGNPGLWTTRWNNTKANLQADGYITAATPIVIGECAKLSSSINPILNAAANADARMAIAHISNVRTDGGVPDVHFLGTQMPLIGARYADMLATIPGAGYAALTSVKNVDGVGFALRDVGNDIKLMGDRDLHDSRRRVAFRARSLVDNVVMPGGGAVFTKVAYGDAQIDTQGTYDPVLSRWWPPAGIYKIEAFIRFTQVAAGETMNIYIYKNGATHLVNFHTAAGVSDTMSISGVVESNGRDYFEVFAQCINDFEVRGTSAFGLFSGHEI